jgi:hypothetical protein
MKTNQSINIIVMASLCICSVGIGVLISGCSIETITHSTTSSVKLTPDQQTQGLIGLLKQDANDRQKAGIMTVSQSMKLDNIVDSDLYQHEKISDKQLSWVIDLIEGKGGILNPKHNWMREQEVMLEFARINDLSQQQKNLYLPVLLTYLNSSNAAARTIANESVRDAALKGLWSLKDIRAASAIAKIVNEPNSGLSASNRKKYAAFIQHCKS